MKVRFLLDPKKMKNFNSNYVIVKEIKSTTMVRLDLLLAIMRSLLSNPEYRPGNLGLSGDKVEKWSIGSGLDIRNGNSIDESNKQLRHSSISAQDSTSYDVVVLLSAIIDELESMGFVEVKGMYKNKIDLIIKIVKGEIDMGEINIWDIKVVLKGILECCILLDKYFVSRELELGLTSIFVAELSDNPENDKIREMAKNKTLYSSYITEKWCIQDSLECIKSVVVVKKVWPLLGNLFELKLGNGLLFENAFDTCDGGKIVSSSTILLKEYWKNWVKDWIGGISFEKILEKEFEKPFIKAIKRLEENGKPEVAERYKKVMLSFKNNIRIRIGLLGGKEFYEDTTGEGVVLVGLLNPIWFYGSNNKLSVEEAFHWGEMFGSIHKGMLVSASSVVGNWEDKYLLKLKLESVLKDKGYLPYSISQKMWEISNINAPENKVRASKEVVAYIEREVLDMLWKEFSGVNWIKLDSLDSMRKAMLSYKNKLALEKKDYLNFNRKEIEYEFKLVEDYVEKLNNVVLVRFMEKLLKGISIEKLEDLDISSNLLNVLENMKVGSSEFELWFSNFKDVLEELENDFETKRATEKFWVGYKEILKNTKITNKKELSGDNDILVELVTELSDYGSKIWNVKMADKLLEIVNEHHKNVTLKGGFIYLGKRLRKKYYEGFLLDPVELKKNNIIQLVSDVNIENVTETWDSQNRDYYTAPEKGLGITKTLNLIRKNVKLSVSSEVSVRCFILLGKLLSENDNLNKECKRYLYLVWIIYGVLHGNGIIKSFFIFKYINWWKINDNINRMDLNSMNWELAVHKSIKGIKSISNLLSDKDREVEVANTIFGLHLKNGNLFPGWKGKKDNSFRLSKLYNSAIEVKLDDELLTNKEYMYKIKDTGLKPLKISPRILDKVVNESLEGNLKPSVKWDEKIKTDPYLSKNDEDNSVKKNKMFKSDDSERFEYYNWLLNIGRSNYRDPEIESRDSFGKPLTWSSKSRGISEILRDLDYVEIVGYSWSTDYGMLISNTTNTVGSLYIEEEKKVKTEKLELEKELDKYNLGHESIFKSRGLESSFGKEIYGTKKIPVLDLKELNMKRLNNPNIEIKAMNSDRVIIFEKGQILLDDKDTIFENGKVMSSDKAIIFDGGNAIFENGKLLDDKGVVKHDSGKLIFSEDKVVYDDGETIMQYGKVCFDDGKVFSVEGKVDCITPEVFVENMEDTIYVKTKYIAILNYLQECVSDKVEANLKLFEDSFKNSWLSKRGSLNNGIVSINLKTGDVIMPVNNNLEKAIKIKWKYILPELLINNEEGVKHLFNNGLFDYTKYEWKLELIVTSSNLNIKEDLKVLPIIEAIPFRNSEEENDWYKNSFKGLCYTPGNMRDLYWKVGEPGKKDIYLKREWKIKLIREVNIEAGMEPWEYERAYRPKDTWDAEPDLSNYEDGWKPTWLISLSESWNRSKDAVEIGKSNFNNMYHGDWQERLPNWIDYKWGTLSFLLESLKKTRVQYGIRNKKFYAVFGSQRTKNPDYTGESEEPKWILNENASVGPKRRSAMRKRLVGLRHKWWLGSEPTGIRGVGPIGTSNKGIIESALNITVLANKVILLFEKGEVKEARKLVLKVYNKYQNLRLSVIAGQMKTGKEFINIFNTLEILFPSPKIEGFNPHLDWGSRKKKVNKYEMKIYKAVRIVQDYVPNILRKCGYLTDTLEHIKEFYLPLKGKTRNERGYRLSSKHRRWSKSNKKLQRLYMKNAKWSSNRYHEPKVKVWNDFDVQDYINYPWMTDRVFKSSPGLDKLWFNDNSEGAIENSFKELFPNRLKINRNSRLCLNNIRKEFNLLDYQSSTRNIVRKVKNIDSYIQRWWYFSKEHEGNRYYNKSDMLQWFQIVGAGRSLTSKRTDGSKRNSRNIIRSLIGIPDQATQVGLRRGRINSYSKAYKQKRELVKNVANYIQYSDSKTIKLSLADLLRGKVTINLSTKLKRSKWNELGTVLNKRRLFIKQEYNNYYSFLLETYGMSRENFEEKRRLFFNPHFVEGHGYGVVYHPLKEELDSIANNSEKKIIWLNDSGRLIRPINKELKIKPIKIGNF